MNRFEIVASAVLVALAVAACGGTTYTTTLSGANEVPAVTTTGSGTVTGTLNGTTLDFTGSYTGLSGPATMAHMHGPADAGVNAGILCTLTAATTDGGTGTISGSCPSVDVASLNAGQTYVNVHTSANPNGEIRGQLAKQ